MPPQQLQPNSMSLRRRRLIPFWRDGRNGRPAQPVLLEWPRCAFSASSWCDSQAARRCRWSRGSGVRIGRRPQQQTPPTAIWKRGVARRHSIRGQLNRFMYRTEDERRFPAEISYFEQCMQRKGFEQRRSIALAARTISPNITAACLSCLRIAVRRVDARDTRPGRSAHGALCRRDRGLGAVGRCRQPAVAPQKAL